MNKDNIYRKKTCDLCGATTFEKFVKVVEELDGGFTQIEKWEESGFGNMVVNYWNIASVKEKRFEYSLCPNCANKIDSFLHSKIDELKKEAAKNCISVEEEHSDMPSHLHGLYKPRFSLHGLCKPRFGIDEYGKVISVK